MSKTAGLVITMLGLAGLGVNYFMFTPNALFKLQKGDG